MTSTNDPGREVVLRTLGADDTAALADIVEQFWGLEADECPVAEFLAEPSGCVIAAYLGTKLVGYTFGYRLPRFDGAPIALLWDLEVKTAHRGHGIAAALVDRFRVETGTGRRALLLVEPDNTALKNLCEKMGAVAGAPAMIYNFDAQQ